MISSLTVKSFIYFELIFAHDIREGRTGFGVQAPQLVCLLLANVQCLLTFVLHGMSRVFNCT